MSVYLESELEQKMHHWESSQVDSMDPYPVTDDMVRGICAHVWRTYGMPGSPPLVRRIPPTDPGYISGLVASMAQDGTYLTLYQKHINTVTVLHELAHVLTEDPLDRVEMRRLNEREVHGSLWVTNYLDLLDRFMGPRFNKLRLMHTLNGVPVKPGWAPVIWGKQRGDL